MANPEQTTKCRQQKIGLDHSCSNGQMLVKRYCSRDPKGYIVIVIMDLIRDRYREDGDVPVTMVMCRDAVDSTAIACSVYTCRRD